MPDYKRVYIEGGTYFFTLATARRAPLLAAPETRLILRTAIQKVRCRHPFEIVGMVVLPDHLHALWRLPAGDSDFSIRWRLNQNAYDPVCRPRQAPLASAVLGARHSR